MTDKSEIKFLKKENERLKTELISTQEEISKVKKDAAGEAANMEQIKTLTIENTSLKQNVAIVEEMNKGLAKDLEIAEENLGKKDKELKEKSGSSFEVKEIKLQLEEKNLQIKQISESLKEKDEMIQKLEGTVDTLKSQPTADPEDAKKIAELEKTITTKNSEIFKLEDKVVKLQTAISDRKTKDESRFAALKDSKLNQISKSDLQKSLLQKAQEIEDKNRIELALRQKLKEVLEFQKDMMDKDDEGSIKRLKDLTFKYAMKSQECVLLRQKIREASQFCFEISEAKVEYTGGDEDDINSNS